MENYIELELTKIERYLLNYYNDTQSCERFVINNPKICVNQIGVIKSIQICPNSSFWAITVYQTKRKKTITEHEAHCKTLKYLKILNGLASL